MSFGENLRIMRRRAGISQAHLAERIRVAGRKPHRSYIAKLETGKIDPRLSTARAIARVFGVPVWLLLAEPGEGGGRWLAQYQALTPAQKREVQRHVLWLYRGDRWSGG